MEVCATERASKSSYLWIKIEKNRAGGGGWRDRQVTSPRVPGRQTEKSKGSSKDQECRLVWHSFVAAGQWPRNYVKGEGEKKKFRRAAKLMGIWLLTVQYSN